MLIEFLHLCHWIRTSIYIVLGKEGDWSIADKNVIDLCLRIFYNVHEVLSKFFVNVSHYSSQVLLTQKIVIKWVQAQST